MSPMLAILTDERFSDPNWLFERKLDGIRCLAFKKGPRVTLLSRNRARKNATYPELVELSLARIVIGELKRGQQLPAKVVREKQERSARPVQRRNAARKKRQRGPSGER